MPPVRHLIFFVCAMLLCAAPAQAAMHFCNHTQKPIDTALGYREDEVWVSEGWWRLEAGQCARVYAPPLTGRFYFYYAMSLVKSDKDKAPFTWSGKYEFCIDAKPFKITGDGACENRGYQTRGFQQMDLGSNTRDYTLDFKDDGAGK